MLRNRDMTMTGALESTTVRVSPHWQKVSRSNSLICRIEVSAFASVLFVLMLVVWIARTQAFHYGSDVDAGLPVIRQAVTLQSAEREDALTVAVQRDGHVFLGCQRLGVEDLSDGIRSSIAHGAEGKAYIRADARAQYGSVKQVLDAIHASGVTNIAFLTDRWKSGTRLR